MIAFDSNVLIYFLENNPLFAAQSENIFREAEKNGGLCSTLAVTETMYGSTNKYNKITPLLSPAINVIPVTQQVAILAGELKIMHGIKNVEAIHLATAITSGASVFITNDQHLLAKNIEGIEIRGL